MSEHAPVAPWLSDGERSQARAFTLIELIAVMAIIVLIMALIVPALGSLIRSGQLNSAGQAVVAQLNLARQSALASNQAVEVRFYRMADPLHPGTAVLRGIQGLRIGPPTSGTTPTYFALDKPLVFPPGIILSSDTSVASTLFDTSAAGFGISPLADNDPTARLPAPDSMATYYSFRFRPTGQTDLTPAATSANGQPISPLMTICSEVAPAVSNGLPANFISIQIDVINGTIRTYQP